MCTNVENWYVQRAATGEGRVKSRGVAEEAIHAVISGGKEDASTTRSKLSVRVAERAESGEISIRNHMDCTHLARPSDPMKAASSKP